MLTPIPQIKKYLAAWKAMEDAHNQKWNGMNGMYASVDDVNNNSTIAHTYNICRRDIETVLNAFGGFEDEVMAMENAIDDYCHTINEYACEVDSLKQLIKELENKQ